MKNIIYLFTLCLMLISCASDFNDNTDQNKIISLSPIQEAKINITSHNHNLSTVMSRCANVNGNMWEHTPSYPLDSEIDGVMAYIGNKPEGVKWSGYNNYYVQQINGAHHSYSYVDYNGACHSMDGTQHMEQLTIIEQDGNSVHVNNFNAGNCINKATNNCTLMDNGFKHIYALSSYSSSPDEGYRIFYYDGNYYIGLDYSAKKDDGCIDADGCYDDWVVKIIPGDNETPKKPNDESPSTKVDTLKGNVETNLSINAPHDEGDYIATKLSVHVRDTTDFTIVMPIPDEYYCQQDDMYIVKNHIDYEYGNTVMTMNIANNEVKVTISYNKDNITISSEGINAEVLKDLRITYGDGLTFEIWNYYNNSITREKLRELLDKSTIAVKTNHYLNSIVNPSLDCCIKQIE